jgi:glutaredoxin
MRRRPVLRAVAAALALGLVGLPGRARAESSLPALADLPALGRDIRASAQPLLVLYTTPGCPHCEQVRRHYLLPRLAAGELVRQVDITSRAPLIDGQGRRTTERDFARAQGVGLTPVLVAMDAQGRVLAEPLVGSDSAGFYEGYLVAMLEAARRKLAAQSPLR